MLVRSAGNAVGVPLLLQRAQTPRWCNFLFPGYFLPGPPIVVEKAVTAGSAPLLAFRIDKHRPRMADRWFPYPCGDCEQLLNGSLSAICKNRFF
jgi:hypothetical protein